MWTPGLKRPRSADDAAGFFNERIGGDGSLHSSAHQCGHRQSRRASPACRSQWHRTGNQPPTRCPASPPGTGLQLSSPRVYGAPNDDPQTFLPPQLLVPLDVGSPTFPSGGSVGVAVTETKVVFFAAEHTLCPLTQPAPAGNSDVAALRKKRGRQ